MLKIFRHIRKGMLAENRFAQYILYAIGEIILVVIGILIALQVNNWNESNKAYIEEQSLLKDLRTDLEQTINAIDKNLSNRNKLLDILNTSYNNLYFAETKSI